MLERSMVVSHIANTVQDPADRADLLGEFSTALPDEVDEGFELFAVQRIAEMLRDRAALAGDTGLHGIASMLNREYSDDLKILEARINTALQQSFEIVVQNPEWTEQMKSIFTAESGRVYDAKLAQGGQDWQKPEWAPHEVHMQYLEKIWEGILPTLTELNLAIDQPLRDSFMQSREQEITATDHNRRFFGTLINKFSQKPNYYFELDVPHSHAEVAYTQPPTIKLSFLNEIP
ncbi:MAG: hypothetical protein AAB373_01135 [Patescibacteria group bacterium]